MYRVFLIFKPICPQSPHTPHPNPLALGCSSLLKIPTSPSKPHLRLGVPMQCPQKDLIPHPAVVLHVKYLRQANLPWGVPLQRNVRPEKDQQVRLAHDAFRDLGIDEVARDVVGREFLSLRHFRQRFREID